LDRDWAREHKRTVAAARADLADGQASHGDFERFAQLLTATREKKLRHAVLNLLDDLGCFDSDTNSYDRSIYSASLDDAAKHYRKLVSLIDSGNALLEKRDGEFLKGYFLGRMEEVCADTAKVTVGVAAEYTYPAVCCGCLNPNFELVNVKYVSRESRTDGSMLKTSSQLALPFCKECRKSRDYVVQLDWRGVSFANVHYGSAFVVANNSAAYTFYMGEKERSRILAGMLQRRGLPDMTKGVSWDIMKAHYGL
jgi:hypothetical protein